MASSTESPSRENADELRGEDSLSAAIAVWEQSLREAGNSRNTVNAFTADLRLLMHYLGSGRPVAGVSTRDLQDFFHWMETERGVPCSPKTYSRRITSIKSFCRYLTEAGIFGSDPAVAVVQRLVQSPLPEILTLEEARRVLAAARAMRATPGHGRHGRPAFCPGFAAAADRN